MSAAEKASVKPADELPLFCRTHPTLAIFWISLLGLFLQVMLIRWLGTEIRVFAYMQNTILVVCFLGIGLGCFHCHTPIRVRWTLIPLVILLGLLAFPPAWRLLQEIPEWLSAVAYSVVWVDPSGDLWLNLARLVLGLVSVFVLMLLLTVCFVPVGQILGRLMDQHPHTVAAYSVNIVGSLVGVWLFALLSWWYLPPLVWISVLALLLLPFCQSARGISWANAGLTATLLGLAVLAGAEQDYLVVRWSPYQKLAIQEVGFTWEKVLWVKVNNTGYQQMIDRRPEKMSQDAEAFPPEQRGYSQYDIPPLLHRKPLKVLIAGAGTGNDVAGALRHGAEEVTAVEIDPAIIEMGKNYHPEQPYQNPAVKVVNDDARSFFASSQDKFDLIIFGLLDAHTTASLANARLDHYVYTQQSLHQVHQILKPDGLVVLTFEARHPYIVDRIARTLREEFGGEPIVFRVPQNNYGFGGVMFVAGNRAMAEERLHEEKDLGKLVQSWQKQDPIDAALTNTTAIATDDWPYLYLESPSVPALFFLLALLTGALLWVVKRLFGFSHLVSSWDRSHGHFACLGAAFLLLEVQNISRAAVVLGNTWVVSAIIISGVLCMILLANLLVSLRPKMPLMPFYIALLGSCLGLYFVDLAQFATYPTVAKGIIVGGLTTLPMMFSGVIFIQSLQASPHKDEALGANLIGSLIGGLLQAVTYLTGTRALLLIVMAIYAAAIVLTPRSVDQDTAAKKLAGTPGE